MLLKVNTKKKHLNRFDCLLCSVYQRRSLPELEGKDKAGRQKHQES